MGIFTGGLLRYQVFASKENVSKPTDMPQSPSSQESTITGVLRAINGVDLTTESAGLIQTIEFASGSYIKKGEVIVTLNADAELAKLDSLQAVAELAQLTYNRDKEQFSIQGVSRADLDSDLADLKSKKAEVKEQKAIIAKKVIRAPFDGRLGISAVSIGQYLDAGNKIVALQSLDPIHVDFYLPQSLFAHISTNETIYFKTSAYPNMVFEGKVTSVGAKFNPATQRVQVEAILDNPGHKLLPGMSGTIDIKKYTRSF